MRHQHSKSYQFQVSEEDRGLRIDKYLESALQQVKTQGPAITRSFLQKSIDKIRVNESSVKKNYKVRGGDSIYYTIPAPKIIEAESLAITSIYEDSDLLIIHKDPGIVVHPGPGHREGTILHGIMHKLSPELQEQLTTSSFPDEAPRPGIVHRLDKECSGLLIIAKTAFAQDKLREAFKSRRIHKRYTALVTGHIHTSGRWDAAIGRDKRERKKYTTGLHAIKAKPALTLYRPLQRYTRDKEKYTLLDIELITGRSHQIRVHASTEGHSLAGDTIYCKNAVPTGLALCARKLEFEHPRDKKALSFEVGLPKHFIKILQALESANTTQKAYFSRQSA